MHLFSTLRRLEFAPANMSETENGVALAPIVTRKASISDRGIAGLRLAAKSSPSLAVRGSGGRRGTRKFTYLPPPPAVFAQARIVDLLTPRQVSYDTGLPIGEKEPNAGNVWFKRSRPHHSRGVQNK